MRTTCLLAGNDSEDEMVPSAETLVEAPCARVSELDRWGGRVLLVEDTHELEIFVGFVLRQMGFDVTAARNGREAVELAQNESFDLVLMDIQMPVMDGFQATRALRGGGFSAPIVAFTALSRTEDINSCFEAGCSGYLRKPLHQDDLVETLTEFLGSSKNGPA